MLVPVLLLVLGLVILIFGANYMVDGASALAKKFNISNLAIGLTIVAFGTSAPELVVNSFAAADGYSDIVFGNVIGSNNFNLFIILGITGLITPLAVQSSTAWKEIPISLIAVVILFMMVNDQIISPDQTSLLSNFDGFILLFCFLAFLFYVYKQLKNDDVAEEDNIKLLSPLKTTIFIIGGLAGLVLGGQLVVNNAIDIAENMGISQKIIGLTVVAAGTSLPELATSIVAATKKNADIAVGNIIGSNIFNIFLILSTASLIKSIDFNLNFNQDLYILAGGTLFLLLAMFTGKRKRLDRWEALILLVFYLGYTTYLIMQEL
ncbi:calcium/sodium antiporter [Salegentibacter salarius]|uniref:Sodium:proton exchanger n=1 Tax=Salegentibacter salarius TaxID=435906 RepID=A0A2N0TW18_9FLAO|nr:calcium/sodium antiporter [Salegentibacter salarius]OEY72633.1 sodium:proton exchanger [Salegentibacter salarius]PKD18930.1 sodium:proton exchanger [Salegentibacter salarius]SLK01439.1 cation:H+ antiporter [Salegentibacter salarius]